MSENLPFRPKKNEYSRSPLSRLRDRNSPNAPMLPWTRSASSRQKTYSSPAPTVLNRTLHSFTQLLNDLDGSSLCIRSAASMDPGILNNYFGIIYNELQNQGIKNFRMGLMTFDGNTIIVAGMAHPQFSNEALAEVITTLDFKHIFSVYEDKDDDFVYQDDFKNMRLNKFTPSGITYMNSPITDFKNPTDDTVNKLIAFAKNRGKLCQNFIVHCGEGWGRTGIALSILFVNSEEFRVMIYAFVANLYNVYKKSIDEIEEWFKEPFICLLGHYVPEETPTGEMYIPSGCQHTHIDHMGQPIYSCECTKLTHLILEQVRYFETNAGPKDEFSTHGMSVEKMSQLKWIEEYAYKAAKPIIHEYVNALRILASRSQPSSHDS